ncbi:hypothetical protein AVEN_90414-1 [Araneus ventricosus]|uniref:Uncharacterized protein n=1 Tax=Araneus ventricosus TaxID=182803 RepID=A0A4Y2GM62_ARAVE|nr:hypothetical protein AVEN_90414-1 [Araneus ventricosus]
MDRDIDRHSFCKLHAIKIVTYRMQQMIQGAVIQWCKAADAINTDEYKTEESWSRDIFTNFPDFSRSIKFPDFSLISRFCSHPVIYDSYGEEFYEERRGRSLNQGVQQPNSPDLLKNQENSDIEIDDSDAEPDYVATEDGSGSDTIDYDYLNEINTNNHPPSLMLSPPSAPVSAHAECSNKGLPDQSYSSEAGPRNYNPFDYHAFEDFLRESERDDEDDPDYILSDSELENCASDWSDEQNDSGPRRFRFPVLNSDMPMDIPITYLGKNDLEWSSEESNQCVIASAENVIKRFAWIARSS